jgi:hypothetical protein
LGPFLSFWGLRDQTPPSFGPVWGFWGVCHSGQGRFLPFLGLFCQKMSKMGP